MQCIPRQLSARAQEVGGTKKAVGKCSGSRAADLLIQQSMPRDPRSLMDGGLDMEFFLCTEPSRHAPTHT